MRIIFIIIGIAVSVLLLLAIYRYIVVNIQNRKLNKVRLGRIEPIYQKLRNGLEVREDEVLSFASDLLTRKITFQLLKEYKKLELFPNIFNTIEKGAETDLANWLEFPTELDACPDELELEEKVTIDFDGNKVCYCVFKFRTYEPHWAAKDGWMLGVVGPYFDDSKPYDFVSVFSRFTSKQAEISAKEEAKWFHENIAMVR
ncbi:hypothetical protein DMB65_05985 [Flavobacterium cheongpyeongense]|jgi:hypothetical protein|uniref:Uncharacterized protein n=1 Tax=Flavobacterium cheongpyeongense TaxID=2212651 RepID=A0A2V4BRC2_9FLAO|nr:hypothetical protein [Flavobacterium cheongpyeongense]PXY41501.1 hypothetical protein DMB65_05985 [Flavobacterium cheongpyeongense]